MSSELVGCPDGGTCHHQCEQPGRSCWRVHNAAPLSGVFPDDKWPHNAWRVPLQNEGHGMPRPKREPLLYDGYGMGC